MASHNANREDRDSLFSLELLCHRVYAPPEIVIGLLAAQIGTAGGVKLQELHNPIANTSVAENLLDPDRLSSETRKTLAKNGLSATGKKGRTLAIRSLSTLLQSNGSAIDLRIALARLCEDEAEKVANKQPKVVLGYYLTAAETAFPVLVQRSDSPQKQELLAIYNESCAEAATLWFRAKKGGTPPRTVVGPIHPFSLVVDPNGSPESGRADLRQFDQIQSASVLKLKGFEENHFVSGVGGALVGYRAATPERREVNPFLSPFGMAEPISTTLEFRRKNKVTLVYHDVLVRDRVVLFGRALPLEADYRATVATLMSHEPAKSVGWEGMVHPDDCLQYQGLYSLHGYRPDKIPLILVHGLMSSPDTWMVLVSKIYSDPVLRNRYQILVYEYPTGFPIPHNAAGLRRRLHQWVETYDPDHSNPGTKNMVMIGHSMGGLLTSMQLRNGGDPIWYAIHPEPIDHIDASDKQKKALEELVYFKANPDITRAIFICAPHRGSDLANSPLGQLGVFLMKQPFQGWEGLDHKLSGEPSALEDTILFHPTNGIDDLLAHSEVLDSIVALPIQSNTTFHSVVGNRGKKGALGTSSDGVVEYWSSHLDGAKSEHVVPTSHTGATGAPETAEEVRRILYLHAGVPYTPR